MKHFSAHIATVQIIALVQLNALSVKCQEALTPQIEHDDRPSENFE
jgi:hypothetical protein